MAKKNASIGPVIRRFVRALEQDIPVEKVILFGSWASGKSRPNSDIDLIVVSPSFARGKHIENMQYLFRRAARVDARIEPIPAAPGELRDLDERTFLAQAVASGKVCYAKEAIQ